MFNFSTLGHAISDALERMKDKFSEEDEMMHLGRELYISGRTPRSDQERHALEMYEDTIL